MEKIADERLIGNVSNKKLVGVLFGIMIIALLGTFYSVFQNKITGFATSGIVEVRVQAFSSINVNNNVYFGNSTISNNPANLTSISTESSNFQTTFNNCTVVNGGPTYNDPMRDCMGMEVENNGNVNVNITMSASKNVATFFDSAGDIGANFSFTVMDGNKTKNETAQPIMGISANIGTFNASCHPNVNANNVSIQPTGSYLDGTVMAWRVIPTSAYLICGNLSFSDQNDTITVEFNLTFPADEPVGLKTNTITFIGAQID